MIEKLTIYALVNNAILVCLYKWNVVDIYDKQRRDWMPKWCEFCLFFWLSCFSLIIKSSIINYDLLGYGLACAALSCLIRRFIS